MEIEQTALAPPVLPDQLGLARTQEQYTIVPSAPSTVSLIRKRDLGLPEPTESAEGQWDPADFPISTAVTASVARRCDVWRALTPPNLQRADVQRVEQSSVAGAALHLAIVYHLHVQQPTHGIALRAVQRTALLGEE